MCIETKVKYDLCRKEWFCHEICYPHVVETHKQIGRPNCPFKTTVTETSSSTRCECKRKHIRCRRRDKQDEYLFERDPATRKSSRGDVKAKESSKKKEDPNAMDEDHVSKKVKTKEPAVKLEEDGKMRY